MNYTEGEFYSQNPHGTHRIVYNDWGDKDANPIICVHGLTGNGFDFDYLAEDLIQHGHRLICVDMVGRGRSDFLDPQDYRYEQYIKDLNNLLEHLSLTDPQSVDWIGISMGGLLGMHIAAQANSPIKRFIIDDIGPEVPQEMLDYIYKMIAKPFACDSVKAFEERMRATRGLTWEPLSDEQWAHMAEKNARPLPDGTFTYTYDHNIHVVFKDAPTGHEDLWLLWDKIACPIMLIRGERSLLLTEDIINKMRNSRPTFDLHVFKDCGHAPSLWAPEQIEAIRTWLSQTKIRT